MNKTKRGFTLIELLIVIAIISILAVTVFVALNPAKRIKDSKDAKRSTDIESILTAIHEYIVDNKGSLPTGLTAGMSETQLNVGTTAGGCTLTAVGGCTTTSCVDLSTPLAKYLKTIPADPNIAVGTTGVTNYTVTVDTNGIVTIKACNAEGGVNLSVSR